MFVLGIDDAGRGPVIGPMVLAGVLMKEETESELKKEGVKDSKLLSQNQRIRLAKIIKEKCLDYEIITIEPREIDFRIESGLNLNKIEAIKMAFIINKLTSKVKEVVRIYIDCPSVNIPVWRNYLRQYVENAEKFQFRVEHKCDLNHICCGAASILAKVKREEEIEKIKKKIKMDFGSGYPSDPVTKEFVSKYFNKFRNLGIFRESWETISDFREKKEQKSLENF